MLLQLNFVVAFFCKPISSLGTCHTIRREVEERRDVREASGQIVTKAVVMKGKADQCVETLCPPNAPTSY